MTSEQQVELRAAILEWADARTSAIERAGDPGVYDRLAAAEDRLAGGIIRLTYQTADLVSG